MSMMALCSNCVHVNVCSFKQEFYEFTEAKIKLLAESNEKFDLLASCKEYLRVNVSRGL
jgi:hypothetical protein